MPLARSLHRREGTVAANLGKIARRAGLNFAGMRVLPGCCACFDCWGSGTGSAVAAACEMVLRKHVISAEKPSRSLVRPVYCRRQISRLRSGHRTDDS